MWTENTRLDHDRRELRYASDLRDAEWALIAPFMPSRCRRGRPREVSLRSVVDAILYVLRTGCPWRFLPKEFPARSTVQGYFYRWRDDGMWERMLAVLVGRARRRAGRKAVPSAAVIDTQSVKTTESGGPRRQAARGPAPTLRQALPRLRRPRLPRQEADRGDRRKRPLDDPDRHPKAVPRALPARTQALGHRKDIRLAGTEPTPREGRRGHSHDRQSMDPGRKCATTRQKARETENETKRQ